MEKNADLQDLIDNPRETMDCELKNWLDLDDQLQKAKLAKHIAAIANHGGGYIILGFNDDLSTAEPVPVTFKGYDRDTISGIVKKYLSPLVECNVDFITSAKSLKKHPIISVASHGSVPICTIADGPQDEKTKRPDGIKNSTYYIRSTQPESVEIRRHEDWQPLIQRCVMRERDKILKGIAAIMNKNSESLSATHESLKQWQDRVLEVFLDEVRNLPKDVWPVPLDINHCQLSFRIIQEDSQSIAIDVLRRDLFKIHNEVRQFIKTGWGSFLPSNQQGLTPKIIADLIDNEDVEVLQSNLLLDGILIREFWRLSSNGWGSLIRSYLADIDPTMQSGVLTKPGATLSPVWTAMEVMEFVRTVREFCTYFLTSHSFELNVAYRGIEGRYLSEPGPLMPFLGKKSVSASREVKLTVSIAEFDADPYTVVAKLLRPIFRLFDGYELSPQWVKQQIAKNKM